MNDWCVAWWSQSLNPRITRVYLADRAGRVDLPVAGCPRTVDCWCVLEDSVPNQWRSVSWPQFQVAGLQARPTASDPLTWLLTDRSVAVLCILCRPTYDGHSVIERACIGRSGHFMLLKLSDVKSSRPSWNRSQNFVLGLDLGLSLEHLSSACPQTFFILAH